MKDWGSPPFSFPVRCPILADEATLSRENGAGKTELEFPEFYFIECKHVKYGKYKE